MTKKTENVMRKIKIEKIILGVGGTGDNLEKGVKLLKIITNRTPSKRKSNKRIPELGVRPGLFVGGIVTIRKDIENTLKRLLSSIDNTLKRSQIAENGFSFGIKEYIEIPGLEYQRDIGIMGLDVTIVFQRTGKRITIKKIKRANVPKRHRVTKDEIIKFMEEKFNTRFV
ncbi:50S ribosomal protein L5 [Candidatus Pacearchaeota archaeon RBG_16_35_8]|uniref:50S ribosomal protein L5, large subunit ribosomal protein L5 n=1 Tax=uncultured archaeon Rifle_16ft_4_minimus_1461 TaxID=1665151 RepID=A0A0H4T0L2_9ARCH|nr:large subunit ribosomal protein L5 [uncultured archaeon]AKQ01091.1 50S ribosomal protein L5, large subunit ribosomal protein L5 [uncultured archaeon Rifle_16ft_4_minimus_1461]OGJ12340.1 MAG: 50S ribosomal protein L5 [Candidatus Pacearchaeota archaeon RBG_16_35_8]